MALIKNLVAENKYSLKCPYKMTPKGICIHNTANDASAENEIAYMRNNNDSTSYHIAIDDIQAIQGLPFDRNGWHAGDGSSGEGNRNYIGIEICYSKSGGTRFINAEKRAAVEVAALLKQFGWSVANVKKHQDFSGKYCPHRTLDTGWQRFLNMVQAELDILNKPAVKVVYRVRKTWTDAASQIGAFSDLDNAKALADKNSGYSVFDEAGKVIYTKKVEAKPVAKQPTPKPTSAPATGVKVELVGSEKITSQYAQSGVFTCKEPLIYFRNKVGIDSRNPVTGNYTKGESVKYNYVVETSKYIYISWIAASGVRRFMPVRDVVNGKLGPLWGTIK